MFYHCLKLPGNLHLKSTTVKLYGMFPLMGNQSAVKKKKKSKSKLYTLMKNCYHSLSVINLQEV